MKKIFCIVALLGFINYASAQNSNPWPTTGNVGIGTVSPTDLLHVNGNARVLKLGMGGSPVSYVNFQNSANVTGATTSYANFTNGIIQSDVVTAIGYNSSLQVSATSAVTNLQHYAAQQGTILAGGAIASQYGFSANSNLTGATNNYGFYGAIAAGTGRWNTYMAGTANNYFAGNVGIGTTSPTTALQVVGDIRFGSNSNYTDLKISTQTPLSGYNQTNVVTSLTSPGSGIAKAALYLKNAGSVGITRMDLLVDGNVGIGTTAPISKLQVGVPTGTTSVALSNDANIFGAYSATRGNLNIGTTDAADADKGGMLTFSGESGQTSSPYYFGGIRGAKEGAGTYQGYLGFYTIPSNSTLTERMRITSTGNVGIGTTNPTGQLQVKMASGTDLLANNNSVDIGVNGVTAGWARAFRIVNTSGSNGLDGGAFGVTGTGSTPSYAYMAIPTTEALGYNSTKIMMLNNSGDVGIGTKAPFKKLHVSGGNMALSTLDFLSSGTGSVLLLGQNGTSGNVYSLIQAAIDGPNTGGILALNPNGGSVSIGTTDPKTYKLAVNGSVIATSVTVKLFNDWPDYVFNQDYKLPTLTEVKEYIDKNGHLPDMPSEKEVTDNGLNLGEMNKILTKKVEELTLYLIDQNKRIEKLESLLKKSAAH